MHCIAQSDSARVLSSVRARCFGRLVAMERASIKPEKNHEQMQAFLDNDGPVTWWKFSECPVEGCTTFKNAAAWSMQSEAKAIAYMKHHLMKSSAPGHTMDRSAADEAIDWMLITEEEWSHEDRVDWQERHESGDWHQQGRNKRQKHQANERVAADEVRSAPVGGPPIPIDQWPLGGTPRASPLTSSTACNQIAQAVVAAIQGQRTGGQPSLRAEHPGLTLVSGGVQAIGNMPGDSMHAAHVQLPTIGVAVQQTVLESLLRIADTIRSAMHHGLMNIRNLQAELAVIESAIATLRHNNV